MEGTIISWHCLLFRVIQRSINSISVHFLSCSNILLWIETCLQVTCRIEFQLSLDIQGHRVNFHLISSASPPSISYIPSRHLLSLALFPKWLYVYAFVHFVPSQKFSFFLKINCDFGGAFPDFPKQHLALSVTQRLAHCGIIDMFTCLFTLPASPLPHFVPPSTAIGWYHDGSNCLVLYISKT